MSSIAKLALQLSADASGLFGVLDKTTNRLQQFGRMATQPFANASRQIGNIGGLFSGAFNFAINPLAPLESAFQSFFDLVGEGSQIGKIRDTALAADRLGVSTENLIAVARLAKLEISEVVPAIFKMQAAFAKQGLTADEATVPLEHFQIDVEKLKNAGFDAQFEAIVTRMQQMTSESDRAGLAMAAFGRGGLAMVAALKQGPEALKKVKEEMERSGGLYSREDAQRAVDAADAVKRLKLSFEGVKTQLALSFAPLITDIANGIQSWIDKMGGGREVAKAIARTFFDIAIAVVEIARGIRDLVESLNVVKGIKGAAEGVADKVLATKPGGGAGADAGAASDRLQQAIDRLNALKQGVDDLGKTNPLKGMEDFQKATGKGVNAWNLDEFQKWQAAQQKLMEDAEAQKEFEVMARQTAVTMQKEADAFGLDADAAKIFEMRVKKATQATIDLAVAALGQKEAAVNMAKGWAAVKGELEANRTPAEVFADAVERINSMKEKLGPVQTARSLARAANAFQGATPPAQLAPGLQEGTSAAVSAINLAFAGVGDTNPFRRMEEIMKQQNAIDERIRIAVEKMANEAGVNVFP